VREADVMWSKTIWRMMDLQEKMNLNLYYPRTKIETRMSLIDLLLWGIDTQGMRAFKTDTEDYEFKQPMTRDEINVGFDAKAKTQMITDVETGELKEVTVPGEVRSYEVKKYLLKELWFFDRQRSVMEVRIIGICPIRIYFKPEDVEQLEPIPKRLFWIYFPEARKILANHEVFNPYNDADKLTFDDLFHKRFFSSFVFRESNTFENRYINDYSSGIESLLEADRIKQNIFNMEHDLWEF
jgi:gliding motility associated protien GldN